MSTFACSSPEELSEVLAQAHQAARPLPPPDLSRLNRILDHAPEDMTVTVESGVTLPDLQKRLHCHGQWLPLDPRFPETITIEHLLSHNLSGPRRCGYGTVREHLIGIRVALADGRLIRSGGRVVKNVAGYDLAKLFVGARGTLGIPVEATFKLQPLPERECLLQRHFRSLAEADDLLQAVFDSSLTPMVLDLHRGTNPESCALVLGLAGTEEEVAWQRQEAAVLQVEQVGDWKLESDFWKASAGPSPQSWSVAPSRLMEALAQLGEVRWLARAGQGSILHHGPARPATNLPVNLMRRLKHSFDPHAVLPELPW